MASLKAQLAVAAVEVMPPDIEGVVAQLAAAEAKNGELAAALDATEAELERAAKATTVQVRPV